MEINEIVDGLNECQKKDLKENGYTNECFFDGENLTKEYSFNLKKGKLYYRIDCGTSGVFMVDMNGEIYNIKAYGVIDKNKKIKANLGNIGDYNSENIDYLFKKRYNYLR